MQTRKVKSMYLDKVIKALNDYEDAKQKAKETFESAKISLADYYGNGSAYKEKLTEIEAAYKKTLTEATQKRSATVKEGFENLKKAVNDFVTTPVPEGFLQTLEAIKATGKGLTEAEAKLYLEKYKNNYIAYKGLAQTIQEQTGKHQYVAGYDGIIEEIKYYEGYVERIMLDGANGYVKALFGSETNSPLLKLDATIHNFITSDVGSITEAETMQG